MFNKKESLKPHQIMPHLPEQATPVASSACDGCPLKQQSGHTTCSTIKMTGSTEPKNRINLDELRAMQFAIDERQRIVEGIVSSDGDMYYPYNSADAFNFAYKTTYKIDNVDGYDITLESIDGSPREILEATWRERDPDYGYFWINGFEQYCAISPGMMLTIDWPSSRAPSVCARIMQVINVDDDNNKITVRTNQILDGALLTLHDEDDPDFHTCKIWTYGKSDKKWQYVVNPHYFYGTNVFKEITVADDIPLDGIYEIEQSVIATPDGDFLEMLSPVFSIDGYDGNSWVSIHEHNRLHVTSAGGGSAVYCFKSNKPVGSIRDDVFDDLTTTYSVFRLSYYVPANPSSGNCKLIQYDRCYNARLDLTNSVAAYDGVDGVNGNNFCAERVFNTYNFIDDFNRIDNLSVPPALPDGIYDRVDVVKNQPSAIDNFTSACVQYGYCDKWTNSISQRDSQSPFSLQDTLGSYLTQLIFSCDFRLQQKAVGANGFGGFELQRKGTPSIMYQLGYHGSGLATPGGWHPQSAWPYEGSWGEPIIYIDDNGDEHLDMAKGYERGYAYSDYEINGNDEWVNTNVERDAFLPKNVSDYKDTRDPFDFDLTVETKQLHQLGAMVRKDEGTIDKSRGISKSSVSLKSQDIILPNINMTVQDTPQIRDAGNVTINSDGSIKIVIDPLRQGLKSPEVLGGRTISSVTDLGSGRYRIELKNERKQFSRFSVGDPFTLGDSSDIIYSVECGGVWPVGVYEHQVFNSFESGIYKNTGSRNAGARPLDTVRFSDGHKCIIEAVHPYAGSEAPTWGSKQLVSAHQCEGFWQAETQQDDDGNDLTPINITSVKRTSDNTLFAINIDPDKPDAMPSLTCWFDGNNRIYFSHLDHAETVEIIYKDAGDNNFTRYHYIDQYQYAYSDLDWTDYSSADTTTVFLGNDPATIISSGYPNPGEIKIVSNSGKIMISYNIADSPKSIRLVLDYAINSDPPEHDWTIDGRFLDYGKKRDVIIVKDTTDFFQDSKVGDPIDIVASDSVFLADAYKVEWVKYTQNDWEEIAGIDATMYNGARGEIIIPPALVAASVTDDVVCFKIKNLRYIDHRGNISGELINKIQEFFNTDIYVRTRFGSGLAQGISPYAEAFLPVQLDLRNPETPNDNCYLPTASFGEMDVYSHNFGSQNRVQIVMGGALGPGNSMRTNQALVEYQVLQTLGLPSVIKNLPSGCEILDAKMELKTSGLTRYYYEYHGEVFDVDTNKVIKNEEIITSTTLEDISYSFVGFKTKDDWEEIGTIPGASSGKKVVDCTSIMEALLIAKDDGTYPFGFGVIVVPAEASSNIEDLVPKEVPEIATVTGPSQNCGSNSWFNSTSTTTITWDGVDIGDIVLKIKWPENYLETGVLQHRLPSMIDLS